MNALVEDQIRTLLKYRTYHGDQRDEDLDGACMMLRAIAAENERLREQKNALVEALLDARDAVEICIFLDDGETLYSRIETALKKAGVE